MRAFPLRSGRVHRIVNVFECGADLSDEVPSGIRERNATGRAIEQANAQLALQLTDGVAQRRCRQPQLQRRCPERSPARNGKYRIELNQSIVRHYPDFHNVASRFITIIGTRVQHYIGIVETGTPKRCIPPACRR